MVQCKFRLDLFISFDMVLGEVITDTLRPGRAHCWYVADYFDTSQVASHFLQYYVFVLSKHLQNHLQNDRDSLLHSQLHSVPMWSLLSWMMSSKQLEPYPREVIHLKSSCCTSSWSSLSVCGFSFIINSCAHDRIDSIGINADTPWCWGYLEIHCIYIV